MCLTFDDLQIILRIIIIILQQHLQVNKGETKLALQVAQRSHNAQERAMGYLLVSKP